MSKVVRGLFAVAFFLVGLRKEQKTASCSSQSIQLQERERENRQEKGEEQAIISLQECCVF